VPWAIPAHVGTGLRPVPAGQSPASTHFEFFLILQALFFGWFGVQAFAAGERKMGGSTEQAAFLRRERTLVLVGVDELVALFGRQIAHAADRPVDGLTAVGRQLPELLKELARLLLLISSQVLPGSHAVEHALLLLWRQAGKMLQPSVQLGLLLRRKPSELRIVFERAVLLRGRQIFIAAEPVSGVAGLVLRRTNFVLKLALVSLLTLLLLMLLLRMRLWRPLRRQMPGLGERRRQQQKRCQTARNSCPAQHALVPC
jgi:hypothetical protein